MSAIIPKDKDIVGGNMTALRRVYRVKAVSESRKVGELVVDDRREHARIAVVHIIELFFGFLRRECRQFIRVQLLVVAQGPPTATLRIEDEPERHSGPRAWL